jgi:hypothetical protein
VVHFDLSEEVFAADAQVVGGVGFRLFACVRPPVIVGERCRTVSGAPFG